MTSAAAHPPGEPNSEFLLVTAEPAGHPSAAMQPEPVSELWHTHGSALLQFAQKLTLGDRQRAEDIVQETLLRAWRHREVIGTGPASIRPWLYTVARRVAIDMWRARSVPKEIVDDRQTDMADPVDPIEQTITGLDVRAALATLSTAHRQVIVDIYYKNRSVEETARALGIPVGTVKSRAHYAIRELRRVLATSGKTVTKTEPRERLSA